MAKLHKIDGSVEEVVPSSGSKFSLEELQKFVNGYVEVGELDEELYYVVNEDGRALGLCMNPRCPHLVGDVLVASGDELGAEGGG